MRIARYAPLCALALLLCFSPAWASSPTDVVPDGSGLYDAVALLAQQHLLPPGGPDATDLLGVSHRLRTRAEFASLLAGITKEPSDPRAQAALEYARNILAPELGQHGGTGVGPASIAPTGFVQPTLEGRDDNGSNLQSRGYILGRGRLSGTLGRDGAYTFSATNIYRQTRDHASFTTRNAGTAGGDSPDILTGIDEAYATVVGSHGIRASAGLMRRRWGPGYRGDMLVSDTAPARPSVELEFPFYLGRTFGSYRFTQYESAYHNNGAPIYNGGRRLEHPIGDRVTVDLQESYTSDQFKASQLAVLVYPYYTYQAHFFANQDEPNHFDYLAAAGITVQPEGPRGPSRVYGQVVLDDIKAPFGLGTGTKTPQKIGYLIGAARTFAASGTDVVAEFAHTDRATYTNAIPSLAWFDDNLPKAYPIGPNGNEIFVRVGQRLDRKLSASFAVRDRRRQSNNFAAPNERSLDFGLDYHLSASRSVGLTLSDYREDPFTGTIPANPFGPPEIAGSFGGASTGQYLRRRIVGVSFLQSF
jgi:hypothetical protein